MKNKLIPIIAIISTFGLAACGGDSSSNANESTTEENIPATNTGNSSSSISGSNTQATTSDISSSSTERSPLETDPVIPSSVKSGSLTDERDGQTYKTVQIGNQVWMAENLKLEVSDGFCYGDVKDNCEKYGTFYTAKTALRICPENWKLPNDEAWKILAQNIGAEYDVSGRSGGGTFIYINDDAISKIRSTSGWTNSNGTDVLGFSAYPAGKFNGTQYSGLGEQAVFMGSNKSSGEDDSWAAISENQIYITGGKVTNSAMPVRCLQELPCDDSNNGEVKGVTICEKGKWRLGTDAEIAVGFKTCNMENKDEIFNSCICDGYSWRKGSDSEIATEFKTCDATNANEVVNGFICENNNWREGNDVEKATDFKQCTLDNNGETANNYACVNGFWHSADSVIIDSQNNRFYVINVSNSKLYVNLGSMSSWDEAMSSCPEGWSLPSSTCNDDSQYKTYFYSAIASYSAYVCGDGLGLQNSHWTTAVTQDNLAFAVFSYDGKEYANTVPKKATRIPWPEAICVKE